MLYFCLFVCVCACLFVLQYKTFWQIIKTTNKYKQLKNENQGSLLTIEMERIKKKCKKMNEMRLLMNKIINDKSKIDIRKRGNDTSNLFYFYCFLRFFVLLYFVFYFFVFFVF